MPPERRKELNDELLTLQEVAEVFKVPVSTLRKWRTSGTGPTGFRVGKYVRFRRSAVEQFIADQEAKAEDY
jgi:excisionase family DNA binding protein